MCFFPPYCWTIFPSQSEHEKSQSPFLMTAQHSITYFQSDFCFQLFTITHTAVVNTPVHVFLHILCKGFYRSPRGIEVFPKFTLKKQSRAGPDGALGVTGLGLRPDSAALCWELWVSRLVDSAAEALGRARHMATKLLKSISMQYFHIHRNTATAFGCLLCELSDSPLSHQLVI